MPNHPSDATPPSRSLFWDDLNEGWQGALFRAHYRHTATVLARTDALVDRLPRPLRRTWLIRLIYDHYDRQLSDDDLPRRRATPTHRKD